MSRYRDSRRPRKPRRSRQRRESYGREARWNPSGGSVREVDRITRQMLRAEPNTLFVFGDNMERRGRGGQAKEMRGEPNAVGIPTKWKPTRGKDAYFKNSDFGEVLADIDAGFNKLEAHLQAGGKVVVPSDGIGTGRAQLSSRAPDIAAYIGGRWAQLLAYRPGQTREESRRVREEAASPRRRAPASAPKKSLAFSAGPRAALLGGIKALTTRGRNKVKARVGVPFIQEVGGRRVEVTYLGGFTFSETVERFGGEEGYARAEGMIRPDQAFPGNIALPDWAWIRAWNPAGHKVKLGEETYWELGRGSGEDGTKAHLYALKLLPAQASSHSIPTDPEELREGIARLEERQAKLGRLADPGRGGAVRERESAERRIEETEAKLEAWREALERAGPDGAAAEEARPATPPPFGVRKLRHKLGFSGPNLQLVIEGHKRVSARKKDLKIGRNTQGYQEIGAHRVFVQNLGEHTFLGTLRLYRGLAGWLGEEGFGASMRLPQAFPSGATGATLADKPTDSDLDWLLSHPLITKGKKYGWVSSWVRRELDAEKVFLYALSLRPFPLKNTVLESCPPDPDLYILPITPVMLGRYISAALLWLSEQAPVRRAAEKAASGKGVLAALQEIVFPGGISLSLTEPQARSVLHLVFETYHGPEGKMLDYPEFRGRHGPTTTRKRILGYPIKEKSGETRRADLPKSATAPPDFGIYSKYLGDIGSVESFVATFGSGAERPIGASSLAELSEAYTTSLHRAEVLPTFFRAPGRKNRRPVALVVTGSISTIEGMSLVPPEPGRNVEKDFIPIVEAMTENQSAARSHRSTQVCFLLPPRVTFGFGAKEKEIVGSAGYLRQLMGLDLETGVRDDRRASLLSSVGFQRLADRLRHSPRWRGSKGYRQYDRRLAELIRLRTEDEVWLEQARKKMDEAEAAGRKYRPPKRGSQEWKYEPDAEPGTAHRPSLREHKSRNLLSEPPEWVQDPKGEDWYFADESRSGDYFGEFPLVQAWPGIYSSVVTTLRLLKKAPLTRRRIEALIKQTGLDLETFRRIAQDSELEDALKEFGDPLRQAEEYTGRGRPPDKRIYLEDLRWSEKAIIDFGEDIRTGEYAPLRGQIYAWEPAEARGQKRSFLTSLYDAYMRLWKPLVGRSSVEEMEERAEAGKNLLDPLIATVFLINKDAAIRASRRKQLHVLKPVTKEGVDLLLKSAAVVQLGDTPWYLGLGATEIMTKDSDTGLIDSYPSPFMGKRKDVLGIAKRLLRVEVITAETGQERRPFLSFILPKPGDAAWQKEVQHREGGMEVMWDTLEAPYLLRKVATWDRGEGRYVSADFEEGRAYKKGVKEAFRFKGRSPAVASGRLAVTEGREVGGKGTKRGERQEKGRVPEKGGFKPQGFYKVVSDTIDATGTQFSRRDREHRDKLGTVYSAFQLNWPELLGIISREIDLPEGTPPPIPGLPGYSADLEVRALTALQELLRTKGPAVALRSRLYHPPALLPGGDRDPSGRIFAREDFEEAVEAGEPLETQFEEYYDPSTQREILSIENPRSGRRPRKPRPPRRSRRPRRGSRGNPIDDPDTWDVLKEWLKPPYSPVSREVQKDMKFPAPKDDQELIDAVAGIFPRRSAKRPKEAPSHRELKPVASFQTLQKHTALHRFARRDYDAGLDATLQYAIEGDVMAAEEQKYLAHRAELSAEEARDIALARKRSKSTGRILSPSGAVCKMYRNTPKLKGYRAPPEVEGPDAVGTAWVWIGPAQPDLSRTRIMSFRQGTHIDCDRVVGESFSRDLGRVLQSLLLWLAEKPTRLSRLRYVAIGQAGSKKYRMLWLRNNARSRLDIRNWFEEAYRGDVLVLESTESGGSDAEAYKKALEGEPAQTTRTRGARRIARPFTDEAPERVRPDDEDEDESPLTEVTGDKPPAVPDVDITKTPSRRVKIVGTPTSQEEPPTESSRPGISRFTLGTDIFSQTDDSPDWEGESS